MTPPRDSWEAFFPLVFIFVKRTFSVQPPQSARLDDLLKLMILLQLAHEVVVILDVIDGDVDGI